jgi:hypothetical protein
VSVSEQARFASVLLEDRADDGCLAATVRDALAVWCGSQLGRLAASARALGQLSGDD